MLLPLLLPLLAVISAAAWLFEIMGCGEIRDFLQPANGRAKRRCAARVAAANAAARRVPLIVLRGIARGAYLLLRLLVALPFLVVTNGFTHLFVLPLGALRVGCGHKYGQDGQVGDVRTLAQWLRITPFHESVEEGAERLVLLREVVQHNAPILGLPLLLPLLAIYVVVLAIAAAAAAAALPAARVVPAAHRCLGIDGEWAATLPATAAALCAHMRAALAPSAAGGRARALSVRLIWELVLLLLLPASAVVLVVAYYPVALLVLFPALAADLAYRECSNHLRSLSDRENAYECEWSHLRLGAIGLARAPFVAPGHWYRKTLHSALTAAAAPPIALFRAVNYALGGLCFVLLLAVALPVALVAALVAPTRCAALVDPGRPPPPAASPRTSPPPGTPGNGVSRNASADDDEAAPAPAAALPQFVRPGRPVGPEAEQPSCRRRRRRRRRRSWRRRWNGCSAATTTAPPPPLGSRRRTAG